MSEKQGTDKKKKRCRHKSGNKKKSREKKSTESKGNQEETFLISREKLPKVEFEEYISDDSCSVGLKSGVLCKGVIRINARKFTDAFIHNSTYGEKDIYIKGIAARNRALPGDIVAVKLLPDEDESQKRGQVVRIIEHKHCRVASGFIAQYRGNAFGFGLMSPIDNRLPRLMIPLAQCPPDFSKRPQDYSKTLFVSEIVKWDIDLGFAEGKLTRNLGIAGHIDPETEVIIADNDIDCSAFSTKVLNSLPDGDSWLIPEEELSKRKDLRKECIFTIDPPTARDLDDALSCKKIGEEIYEVGVHIADVSYFISEGSPLDDVAKKRATSVYLTQKVIPMLPSVLCEKLCSLNPGVDRLAYSVMWKMKSDGQVLSEWFGRSVIRSCVKLSYNHAQQLIDTPINDGLNQEEFPEVKHFPLELLRNTIHVLFQMSFNLRQRRFNSGALQLNKPKLSFNLDAETGYPNGFCPFEVKDSNRLVEEFMLMANMAVGRRIYSAHPDRAILRNHPPPQPFLMEEVLTVCQQYDIMFDVTDSLSINQSLNNILKVDIESSSCLHPAVVHLCTKPFRNAMYFCTGTTDDETAYRHYALNVPIYTHFTSPIRRYADVMVHRFLTAALTEGFSVSRSGKQLQKIADHCNDKKQAAKKASAQSAELFLAFYLFKCGPLEEKGVIVGLLDKSFDVFCLRLGVVNRVYCDKLPLLKFDYVSESPSRPKLRLYWKENMQAEGDTIDEKLNSLREQFESKWAMQKSNLDESSPNSPFSSTIVQHLELFTPVIVILFADKKYPTKIKAIVKSPFPKEESLPL